VRYIDMENWSRRDHFSRFSAYDHPHFSMCALVDVTAYRRAVKQRGRSFNTAIVYVLTRVANSIPEFRHRIRSGKVVEHEVVHPGFTITTSSGEFGFCFVDYSDDYTEFAESAADRIAHYGENLSLEDPPGADDQLFMTAIPWVSFTSFKHPMHLDPPDSIPRFAWGRFLEDGDSLKMPLDVQAHHGLMDGMHMGKFFTQVQEYLSNPESLLGKP
jgi:chloramphenicol O-acetyltransferase type A